MQASGDRAIHAHAHAIYDGVLFLCDELAKMSHNVFIAPAGKPYLTSDTPCGWQAPIGFTGLANPLLEITLPLTPRHVLRISRIISTSGYIQDFHARVFSMNLVIPLAHPSKAAIAKRYEDSMYSQQVNWGERHECLQRNHVSTVLWSYSTCNRQVGSMVCRKCKSHPSRTPIPRK